MNITKNNGILVIVGLLVLAAAAYLLMNRGNDEAALTPTAAPSSEAEVQFLSLIAKIEPVAFDTSILTDPRFIRLQDIRTAIVPEQTGRPDPFAPLPGIR